MADSSLRKFDKATTSAFNGSREDSLAEALVEANSESNIFETISVGVGEFGSHVVDILTSVVVLICLFFIKIYGRRIMGAKKTLTNVGKKISAELKEILTPFVKIILTPRLICRNIKKSRKNATAVAIDTIAEGIRNNKSYVKTVFNYAMPVFAAVMLTALVLRAGSLSFVVAVKYGDQTVGYVQNEDDFYTAKSNMEHKIIYQDGEQPIEIAPTFEVTIVDQAYVETTDELTNTLLEIAGENIAEADGFYVDGEFYGAVSNQEEIRSYLDARLAEQRAEHPGDKVDYVNSIEFKSGYYLKDNLEDTEEIYGLIDSESGGKSKYVAQEEETLSLVAAKKSVAAVELAELNGLTSDSIDSLTVTTGQELQLPENVRLLNVQIIREEVTEENVGYEVIREETDELDFGRSEMIQDGQDGVYEVTSTIIIIDGVEVQRKVQEDKTVVIQEKVDKIVRIGIKETDVNINVPLFIQAGEGKFMRPLEYGVGYVSARTGDNRGHQGFDIAASIGTPIYASADGTVTATGQEPNWDGYGIKVEIDHGDGFTSRYAHMSAVVAKVGDEVKQGQLIGYVGNTGRSTGPHLHFEIRYNGVYTDPGQYIGYE